MGRARVRARISSRLADCLPFLPAGAGIAINTGGGAVNLTKNLVFDNCCSAVLFATSQTKQATLSGNDLERNAAGGVQGLHQVAGAARLLPLTLPLTQTFTLTLTFTLTVTAHRSPLTSHLSP